MRNMNVWFVVPEYEDGVWISQDELSDVGYASEKLADKAKEVFDAADHEAHQRRESQRLERSNMYRAARSILEETGFEDVDKVLPFAATEFEPRRFESRYRVMVMEIKE